MDTDGVLVVTLGFATAVQILATTQDDLTGGARGMGGLDFPFDIGRVKDNEFLWLVITAVVVARSSSTSGGSTARPTGAS